MTASFTFTADSGTDVLTTSSAHGKATGDGPVCVRNVGGALPSGLSALTDYWLIVTGASTVKLATSSANALLGTAIDITTNGTGTNYLEIGVPYRRPRTYAVGSQLKSADLNDNFDAWKAVYALLTGQSESIWSGAVSLTGALSVGGNLTLMGQATTGITASANQHITVSGSGRFKHGTMVHNVPPAAGSGSAWAWDATNGYLLSSGAGTWSIGIPTIVGWRVTDITFERYGDGSADLSGGVFRRAKTGTPTTIVSISVTNAAASWIDESCSLGNIDIADGDSLWVALTANAPNLRIGELRATYAMI